jgi:Kef-type K+ transport system membrane component KefB
MLNVSFLLQLAIILLSTKMLGAITKKFHLPQIIGAIIAGLLLGPAVFNVIDGSNDEFIKRLAELGVIVIMFTAGLGVDFKELKTCGKASLIIGSLGVFLPLIGGFTLAAIYSGGFANMNYIQVMQSIFLGVVLTATSVSITVETLMEMGKLNTKTGTTILGAALIDDIIGIVILTVIMGIADASVSVGTVILKIIMFFILAGIIAFIFNKFFDEYTKSQKERRRFTIISFAFCLVLAFIAEHFFGVADITGAFIAGIAISSTKHAHFLKRRFEILSYMLIAPIFFASIGLSINIDKLSGSIIIFGIILIVIAIFSKITGAYIGGKLSGFRPIERLQIGVGMVARAEVALIIAKKGRDILLPGPEKATLMSNEYFTPVVLMVLATAIITPVLIKIVYSRRKTEEIQCVEPTHSAEIDETIDSDSD